MKRILNIDSIAALSVDDLRKQYERDKLAIQALYDKIDHGEIPDFAEKLNELWESTLNELKKEKK